MKNHCWVSRLAEIKISHNLPNMVYKKKKKQKIAKLIYISANYFSSSFNCVN